MAQWPPVFPNVQSMVCDSIVVSFARKNQRTVVTAVFRIVWDGGQRRKAEHDDDLIQRPGNGVRTFNLCSGSVTRQHYSEEGSVAVSLIGLWEQIGYVHPLQRTVVPWPAGSMNASVREYLWFGPDGALAFGRFGTEAVVAFDEPRRVFVTDGHIDAILSGRYRIDGSQLIEEWVTDNGTQVCTVELDECSETQFAVRERVPYLNDPLLVVYRRVSRPSNRSTGKKPAMRVVWVKATHVDQHEDYYVAYRAVVGPSTWLVAVNDFPADMLYTLLVDGEPVRSFNEWPAEWQRPE